MINTTATVDTKEPFWLTAQRAALIGFYAPKIVDETAGYAWLDEDGNPLPGTGSQLWLDARMLHCFAVESSFGTPGARDIARHGLEYLLDPGPDPEFGGWRSIVGGDAPDDRKELYGHAHVLLAASSALRAGIEGAEQLLDLALESLERFALPGNPCGIDAWNRSFTEADPYRGQNANMHLTEALIAAFDATGEAAQLERAAYIAQEIAGAAASNHEGAWRLVEHFDSSWTPLPDHNADDPRHAFRPYGSQPGHWLEWAKLLCQLTARGAVDSWGLAAAEHLFHGAFVDGWADSGGFCYTVDWDGAPVVPEKYWWEVAEGIGAAHYLHELTGNGEYEIYEAGLWHWADEHLIDHARGGWFHEISTENAPSTFTWTGKPDLYHAYQATLYAFTPAGRGFVDAEFATPLA